MVIMAHHTATSLHLSPVPPLVSDTVRAHTCPGGVVVVVTTPDHGTFQTVWCISCLEDADPLDAVSRLVPGSSVSVRAGA